MGRLYASPHGTSVIQLRFIPPRPLAFDGLVTVYGTLSPGDEAMLWERFGDHGEVESCEIRPGGRDDEAVIRFSQHAQAERAVARLQRANATLERQLSGDAAMMHPEAMCVPKQELTATLTYNERPYEERGWCVFEDGVANEAILWTQVYDEQSATFSHAVAKGYIVNEDGTSSEAVLQDMSIPEVQVMVQRIEAAHFTGKGDKQTVVELFQEFRVQVHAVLALGGRTTLGQRGQP